MTALLTSVGIASSGSVLAQSTGGNVKLPMQGVLTNADGQPMQASVTMTFSLYANATASSALWSEAQTVQVGDVFPGVYNVHLGSVTPITADVFKDNADVHIGVRIGTAQEIGRWSIGHTPKSAFSPLSGTAGMGGGGGGPNTMLDDAYVNVTGDVMTGALGLPANGLSCGSNQLVLANGFVGMGTRNPERTLHVVGPDGEVPNAVSAFSDSGLVVENNDNSIIEVISNSASGAGTGRLVFRGANATNYGSLSYDNANRRLQLGADTSANPAMTVLNNGNVGVGTDAPAFPFEIAHGTPELNLRDTSSSGSLRLRLDGVNASITNHSTNGDMTLGTTGNGMFNFVNGDVAMSSNLRVVRNVVANSVNIGSGQAFSWGNQTTMIAGDTSANYMAMATAGQERMRIDGNGNIGIGTNSPSRTLDVVGQARIGRSVAGDNANYQLAIDRHGTAAAPGTTVANGAIRIRDFAADGAASATGVEGLIDVQANNVGVTDPNSENFTSLRVKQGDNFAVTVDGRANMYIGQTSVARNGTLDRSLFVQNSIGVGTSAPNARLHVKSVTQDAAALVVEDDARKLEIGRDQIQVKDIAGNNSTMFLQPNGNLSVNSQAGGTTFGGAVVANRTVNVAGNITTNASICFGGDCRSDWASVISSGAAWLSGSGVTRLRSSGDAVVIGGSAAALSGGSFEVQGRPTRLDGRNSAGLRMDLAGTGDFLIRETATADTVQIGTMYNNISSGNVGIGTDSPDYALQLENPNSPTLSVKDTTNNVHAIMFAQDANIGLASLGAHPIRFYMNGSAANNEVMRLHSNNNVGIGVTAPGERLAVGGNVQASGFCIGTDCRTDWATIAGSMWGRSGTNTTLLNANDNVGIGTNAPATKLDISGDTRLYQGNAGQSPKLFFGNETGVNAKAMFLENYWMVQQVHGNEGLKIRDTSPGGQQQVLAQFNGLSGTNNGDIHLAPIFGNIGVGTASPVTKLDVRGDTRLYAGSAGNSPKLFFGSETNVAAKAMYMENYWMVLQPHGNEGFMIRDTSANGTQQVLAQFNGLSGSNNGNIMLAPVWGNVGIGVNNPTEKLSVEGKIETRSGGWFIARSGDNSNYAHIRNPETAGSALAFHTAGEKMRIRSNGDVGIGTTNPAGKLDVNGTICISGDCKSSWNDVNGGRPWLRAGTDTVLANGADRVGVGTVSPGAKLHVAGGDLFVHDNNGASNNRFRISYAGQSGLATVGPNSTGGSTFIGLGTSLGGTYSEKVRITDTGRVGVGTTNPGGKLDVVQSLANDDDIGVYIKAGTTGERPRLRLGGVANEWEFSANNDYFSLAQATGTGAAEHLVVRQGGNVGMGTSSPGYALHVVGTDPNQQIRVQSQHGNTNLGVDSVGGFVETQSNIPLRLYAGGGERMYINPNGNISVNSRTAYGRFSVNGNISSGNTSSGVGDLTLFDTGNNSWRTRGVSANSFLTDMQGTSAIGNWEVRDMNMNLRGGRLGVGYSANPLGTIQAWNTTPYNGDMGSNGQDSLVLYGAVGNAVGQYHGGITWSNGGRRRAGIASVMERADSDHVGIAFFTRGTDGPGSMFETMRLSRNGNLGIGTQSPSSTLHVAGTGQFDGAVKIVGPNTNYSDTANGRNYPFRIYRQDSSSRHLIMGVNDGSPGYSYIQSANPGLTIPNLVLMPEGNASIGKVGIGTSAPVEKLHVNGRIRGTELCIGGDCRGSWPSGGGGSTYWGQNGNNIFPTNISNNVGIGTNTPGAKLEIAQAGYRTRLSGNGMAFNRAGGDSYIDKTDANKLRFRMGSGNTDVLTLQGNGNVGVGVVSPTAKLEVAGTIRSTLATGDIFHSSNTGVQTVRLTNDNIVGVNHISINDSGAGEGISWPTGQNIAAYYVGQGGENSFRFNSAGAYPFAFHGARFGIGTSAPIGQLHVDGVDARSNPVTVAGSIPGIFLHDTETAGGALRYDSYAMEVDGSNFYIGARSRNSTGNYSGNRRFTIKNDGRVGINTTSPAEELDVRGAIRVGQNAVGDNNYYGVEVFRNGTSAAPGTYRSLKPAFMARDYASVGPSAYQFRGLIHAELPRLATGDTNAANAALFSVYNDSAHTVRIDGKANLQVGYWQETVAGDRNLVVENNVGIGTRTPAAKLHVNGDTFIDGRVGIGWNSNLHRTLSIREGFSLQGSASNTAYLQQYLDGSQNLRFDLYGSAGWRNRMFINNDNGRVGIATTAPAGTLDVNGSLCIDGQCRSNWADVAAQDGAWRRSGSNTLLRSGGDKVGIGTDTPSGRLTVRDTSNGNPVVATLIQQDSDKATGHGPTLEFRAIDTNSGDTVAQIRGVVSNGDSTTTEADSDLSFLTSTDGGANVREAMRIKHDLRVGIGTSSPRERLTVRGGNLEIQNGGELRLRSNTDALRGYFKASEGSPHLDIATSGGEDLAFRDGGTGGDINMFIGGARGVVGIGSNNPNDNFRFRVQGAGAAAGHAATFNGGTDNTYVGVSAGSESHYITQRSNGQFAIHKPGVGDRMTIFGDGNMGIGPSPRNGGGVLNIRGSATVGGQLVRIENDNQSQESGIRFRARTGGANYVHADIATVQRGGANEGFFGIKVPHNNSAGAGYRFVVTHQGRVGINDTTPAGTLDVNGSICISGDCKSTWAAVAQDGGFWSRASGVTYTKFTSDNMGVGTNSAPDKLTVNGNIRVNNGNRLKLMTTSNVERGTIYASESGPHLRIGTTTSEEIGFYDGGALNVLFDGGGNVGIGSGTGVPESRLTVQQSSDGNPILLKLVQTGSDIGTNEGPALEFSNRDSNTTALEARSRIVSANNSGGAGEDDTNLLFSTSTNGALTERMRITHDGRLGLNEATPGATIHARTTATGGQDMLVLEQDVSDKSTSTGPTLQFRINDTNSLQNTAQIRAFVDSAASNADIEDQTGMAFSTSNNGVLAERMRLTYNGRVGINDATPSGTLDVNGSICIRGDCKGSWSQVALSDGYWSRSGSNTFIKNGGDNVGVGTNAPRSKLHVNGDLTVQEASPRLILRGTVSNGVESGRISLREQASDNYGFDLGYNGSSNIFEINRYDNSSTPRLALQVGRSNGWMGVNGAGISEAPIAAQTVADGNQVIMKLIQTGSDISDREGPALEFSNRDSNTTATEARSRIISQNDSGGAGEDDTELSFQTSFNGALNERFRINHDGKVIAGNTFGTGTNPPATFTVHDKQANGNSYNSITIMSSPSSGRAGSSELNFAGYGSGDGGYIDYSRNSGRKLRFRSMETDVNGNERAHSAVATFASNGYLGLGTDNPSSRLHVYNPSGGDAALRLETTSAGDPTIIMASQTNRDGIIKFQENGTNSGQLRYSHNGDNFKFVAASASAVRAQIGESTSYFTSKLGVGTTNPGAQLEVGTQGNHFFHIGGYTKTYAEAVTQCAARGARLATYAEMTDRFAGGSNGPCSWGWTNHNGTGIITYVMQNGAVGGCGGAVGGVRYSTPGLSGRYGANCARDMTSVRGSIVASSALRGKKVELFGGKNNDTAYFGSMVRTANNDYMGLRINQSTGKFMSFDQNGKLTTNGDIQGNRLCIGSDCKSTWPDGAGSTHWNRSGTNVFLKNSGDRVGVGTNSPGAKLDVNLANNGSLRLSGGGSDAGQIEWRNTASRHWNIDQSGDRLRFFTENNSDGAGAEKVTFLENGNVGIGTSNPAQRLHVNGSVRGNVGGALRIDTGNGYIDLGPQNTGYAHIQTNRSQFYFNKRLIVDSGDIKSYNERLELNAYNQNNQLYLNTNGNVGVGTSGPNAKLDVYGTVRLGWEQALGNFGDPFSSGFYSNGGSTIPGDVPDGDHSWTHMISARHENMGNNHQFQLASTYAQNDRMFFRKIATGNNASNPGWNEVATRGSNNFGGDQNVSGNIYAGNLMLGNLEHGSDWPGIKHRSSSQYAVIQNASGETLMNTGNGRIGFRHNNVEQMTLSGSRLGIGTTSPAETLHVNGSIRGNQSGAIRIQSPTGYIDVGAKNGSHAHFYTDRSNYYFNRELRVDTGIVRSHDERLELNAYNQNDQVYLNTNGNVGIGTAAPNQKFGVNGNISLQGAQQLLRDATGDWGVGGTGENFEIFEPEESNKRWAYFQDDWGLVMDTAPNAYIPGRVGIGTRKHANSSDSARGRLHVTQATSRNWTWSGIGAQTSLELGDRNADTVGSIRLNSYDANEFVFIRPSNGNYHIDSSRGAYYFNWDESVRGGNHGELNIADQAGNHNVKLETSGSSWLAGGNVGIGTRSPAERLHVAGAIRGNEAGGALKTRTQHGWIDVGPKNASYAHIETDRSNFYFNKRLTVDSGEVYAYNERLELNAHNQDNQLFLNTNGRVGIGNGNPNGKLDINGNGLVQRVSGGQHITNLPWHNVAGGSAAGYIKLTTPIRRNESNMFLIKINAYLYGKSGAPIEYTCGGYAYGASTLISQWCRSDGEQDVFPVTIGVENDMVVIVIGDNTSGWYYNHFTAQYTGWKEKNADDFRWTKHNGRVASSIDRRGVNNFNNVNISDRYGDITASDTIRGRQLCMGSSCRTTWPSGGGASPWSLNGSNAYRSSNIGIYDSTPSNRLDINTNGVSSGIDLDGRTSLSGYSGDSWLRLNQDGNWGSGVYTPSHFRADGEIRQGGTDYGGYNIQTDGEIYANDYIVAMGGLHVGGTSDPGTDNADIDGTLNVDGNTDLENTYVRHLRMHGTGGDSRAAHEHYAIYQEPGAWTHPYPDMVINYHTGIKMVGYHGYGGIRMYAGYTSNATPTTQTFSTGEGDYNTRVAYNLYTNGSMGVGTTSPDAKLDVETSGTTILKVQGNSTGYVNAAILLESNYGRFQRGLGVFMNHDAGDVEWYAGNPYASPDQYIIARKSTSTHSDSTSETSNALLVVDRSGNVTADGFVKGSQLCIGNSCRTTWPSGGGASPWSLNGSNAYRSSNIGIYDSTPSNRLDINTNDASSGIDLDGRTSLSGYSGDSWLRLNQDRNWSSGVYTPSHFRADGEIRQGGSDYGGYEIQTGGEIYVGNYLVALGGIHVGGTSDPGTDNLLVDGWSKAGNGFTTSADRAQLRWDDRNNYGSTFDFGVQGVMIENHSSESGGFMANADTSAIWSPGDAREGILQIRDEDSMRLRFYFRDNGYAYADSRWSTFSDRRLKENIETIPGALDTIKKLRGVRYDITSEWMHGANIKAGKPVNDEERMNQLGFIAQEVKEILPGLVSVEKPRSKEGDDRELHALNYDGVIPVLVEAVKEQQAIIDDLKAKLEALEKAAEQQKAIQELMKRVEQLESSKDDWQGAPYVTE